MAPKIEIWHLTDSLSELGIVVYSLYVVCCVAFIHYKNQTELTKSKLWHIYWARGTNTLSKWCFTRIPNGILFQ